MSWKWIMPLIAVGMLTFAVLHVVKANQVTPKEAPPSAPATSPFRGPVAGSGVVEARTENVSIGTPLAGLVTSVSVKVNDEVKVGQELFRLDDRALQAELRVRKAALIASMANVEKLRNMPRREEVEPLKAKVSEMKAMLDDSTDQYNRAKELIRTRSIGDEELVRRKHAVETAQAMFDKSNADLALMNAGAWKYDLAIAIAAQTQAEELKRQTEIELTRLVVTAPIAGKVLSLNVRAGEYVVSPASTALLVLGDVETLHIRLDIDESDLPRFREGMPAVATPRGDAERKIPLTFHHAEGMATPKRSLTGAGTERVDTRVLQVIYAAPKNTKGLYVGQQLDVFLDSESKK